MDKTFPEAINGIRSAVMASEVREDIAQGMEYVEQFANTATEKAKEAASSAKTAVDAAGNASEAVSAAIDPTLSVSGKAADAAKVGEAVGQLKEDLDDATSAVGVFLNNLKHYNAFISSDGTWNTNTSGISQCVFVPVNSGDSLHLEHSGKTTCHIAFINEFKPPVNGESASFASNYASVIVLQKSQLSYDAVIPSDCNFVYVLVTNNHSKDCRPTCFKINGYDIVKGTQKNIEYILLHISAEKAVYISDSYGSDTNDGESPQHPKKTLRLSLFNKYSQIFLMSGDTFDIDGLDIVNRNNFKISSYGGVKKPILNGLRKSKNKFSLYSENIYSVHIGEDDIGYIYIDGKESWKRFESFSNFNETLVDETWFYNNVEQTLYVCSLRNITGLYAEYSIANNGISLYICNNVCIDNIEIVGYGIHGIDIKGRCDDLKITNCSIHHIGNALYKKENIRFGNGIQIILIDVTNIEIANNIVHDCFDAGISPQVGSSGTHTKNNNNIIIRNNYIYNCAYPIEIFSSQPDYATLGTVIRDNFIRNCIDITYGYRGAANDTSENGKHGIAQLMLWRLSTKNPSNIEIFGNIFIDSEDYAISYYGVDSGKQYNIHDNVYIIQKKDFIKNPSWYHGKNDTFLNIAKIPSSFEEYAKKSYYNALGLELLKHC